MSFFGRKLGCNPDSLKGKVYDYRLEHMRGAFGLRHGASARKRDLHATLPPIANQGATSSCVGHAVRTAMANAEKRQEIVAPLPSPRAIYYAARVVQGGSMADDGTSIRAALTAAEKIGVCDEVDCKLNFATVNRAPSFGATIKGHARRGGVYARLSSDPALRIIQVIESIDAGHAVMFGTLVDKAFLANDGPEVIGPPNVAQAAGGHAMCIVGYEIDENDATRCRFKIANSWGTSWRKGGYAWLRDSYVTHPVTVDMWVMTGWEALHAA